MHAEPSNVCPARTGVCTAPAPRRRRAPRTRLPAIRADARPHRLAAALGVLDDRRFQHRWHRQRRARAAHCGDRSHHARMHARVGGVDPRHAPEETLHQRRRAAFAFRRASRLMTAVQRAASWARDAAARVPRITYLKLPTSHHRSTRRRRGRSHHPRLRLRRSAPSLKPPPATAQPHPHAPLRSPLPPEPSRPADTTFTTPTPRAAAPPRHRAICTHAARPGLHLRAHIQAGATRQIPATTRQFLN